MLVKRDIIEVKIFKNFEAVKLFLVETCSFLFIFQGSLERLLFDHGKVIFYDFSEFLGDISIHNLSIFVIHLADFLDNSKALFHL